MYVNDCHYIIYINNEYRIYYGIIFSDLYKYFLYIIIYAYNFN